MAANRSGSVLVLLAVDSIGRVSDCRIIERMGDPQFEPLVCTVYRKRARYSPALDSSGQPTASYHLPPRVRFVLGQ
ncbi:MAG: energy transducer TonB [Sphingomonas bacterium]|nr:energy transducer TonB [Sphingomonas bacterium]